MKGFLSLKKRSNHPKISAIPSKWQMSPWRLVVTPITRKFIKPSMSYFLKEDVEESKKDLDEECMNFLLNNRPSFSTLTLIYIKKIISRLWWMVVWWRRLTQRLFISQTPIMKLYLLLRIGRLCKVISRKLGAWRWWCLPVRPIFFLFFMFNGFLAL